MVRLLGGAMGMLVMCVALPARASLADAMQCVCKIMPADDHSSRVGGSGFVFRDDEIDYWILTAGHVLGNSRKCDVYFYVDGEESLPIHGRVAEVNYNRSQETGNSRLRDLGIVKVRKSLLKGQPAPKVARLAPPGTVLRSYDAIFSVGCADLNWPTAWLGKVQAPAGESFHFAPKPAKGRSGSPIFDKDGQHVIGVIVWLETYSGRAISVNGIYEHFPLDTGPVKPLSVARTSAN